MKDEYTSTKKCLERIPDSVYGYKPHPKRMEMGYLTLPAAKRVLWIYHTIKAGAIDFVTYEHFELSTTKKMPEHYEDNYKKAIDILESTTADEPQGTFSSKKQGQLLLSSSKKNRSAPIPISGYITVGN